MSVNIINRQQKVNIVLPFLGYFSGNEIKFRLINIV